MVDAQAFLARQTRFTRAVFICMFFIFDICGGWLAKKMGLWTTDDDEQA